MMSSARLIVLGKPPRIGEGKSRLAADVGAAAAARLARAFLLDTWASVSSFVSQTAELDLVFAPSATLDRYPKLMPPPTIVRQAEGDLGRRMATLAVGALNQHPRTLLLGSDSPGLPHEHIRAALALLDEADVVLGDNPDGGFWCLGLRSGSPALSGNTWLDDLDWDDPQTASQVETRCRRLGLTVTRAPLWVDIDVATDLGALDELLAGDTSLVEHTAAARALGADHAPLSIVVPTLDEGTRLDACLDALAALPHRDEHPLEIVIADGGSSDRSPERAVGRGHIVVTATPAGRGRQLAAGAALSTGATLLFLHVDTRLPSDAFAQIERALHEGAEAGAFVTHTVADPGVPNRAGPMLRLADIRSRVTRHPYGDQALFVTREAYAAVGGFRDMPIMEDYDLTVRLAKRRPLARINSPVQVSGRSIQRNPLRAALLLRVIPPLYRLGVSPTALARLYRL